MVSVPLLLFVFVVFFFDGFFFVGVRNDPLRAVVFVGVILFGLRGFETSGNENCLSWTFEVGLFKWIEIPFWIVI